MVVSQTVLVEAIVDITFPTAVIVSFGNFD